MLGKLWVNDENQFWLCPFLTFPKAILFLALCICLCKCCNRVDGSVSVIACLKGKPQMHSEKSLSDNTLGTAKVTDVARRRAILFMATEHLSWGPTLCSSQQTMCQCLQMHLLRWNNRSANLWGCNRLYCNCSCYGTLSPINRVFPTGGKELLQALRCSALCCLESHVSGPWSTLRYRVE